MLTGFVHLFFHSFCPFLYRPFKSSTTQGRSRLQHGYCIGVSRRSAQATAGKGLAQGPYVAARAGVEPTTLRLKVIVSTKAPPRPTKATLYHKSSKTSSKSAAIKLAINKWRGLAKDIMIVPLLQLQSSFLWL